MCIPRMMTVVVPSPTSSSWVRLSSIMLLAAGCDTSISRRMAWPSLVSTMPPMGSSSIFSMALGPRHDRIMSATLVQGEVLVRVSCVFHYALSNGSPFGYAHILAAAMLDSWAFLPVCLSPLPVSAESYVSAWVSCLCPLEELARSSRGARWRGANVLMTTTGACIVTSFPNQGKGVAREKRVVSRVEEW